MGIFKVIAMRFAPSVSVTVSYSLGLLALLLIGAGPAERNYPNAEKVNGVSLVATRQEVTPEQLESVRKVHANYAAVMPFGFLRALNDPVLFHNNPRQWFGERREGVAQYISELHEKEIKVMLKPQLWVGRGSFTGEIAMENDKDWAIFELLYRDFIVDMACLAEEHKVAMFCVGTELEEVVRQRPGFMIALIAEVRKVYSGKLTYAENWDHFDQVPFWGQLDFIGIDAYFPLSDQHTPTVESCRQAWEPHKKAVEALAEKWSKPVLFTEYGYRSVAYTGKEPWNADRAMSEVNLQAQCNALESLFQEFWEESWFAGGFLWKWFPDHQQAGGKDDSQYTVQNKPAENLLKNYYRRHASLKRQASGS